MISTPEHLSSNEQRTVEPQFNKVPEDKENEFVKLGDRYKQNPNMHLKLNSIQFNCAVHLGQMIK